MFFNCNDFSYYIIISCQRSGHAKHLLFVLSLVAVVVVVGFCFVGVCLFFWFFLGGGFSQQNRESDKFGPCHGDFFFLSSIALRPKQFIYESNRC